MFLEYGVDESSRYVHISQVTSGRVPLQCPYCGHGLIARKGTQKEHHFAHDGNTCRESQRDFESLNVPYFDRFDVHLSSKTWEQLQAFYADRHSYARYLEIENLVIENVFARSRQPTYELTDLGKIPFGELTLSKFADFQLGKVTTRHYELSEAVRLAQFGKPYPYSTHDRWWIEPTPDMVLPNLTDLNIYRSQVHRLFNLSLYLLEIDCDIENLYKVGVTSDIDRRVLEIKRDLSQYTTVKTISVLRLLSNRGAIERYALHRYREHCKPIDSLSEYFQFDKSTRRNVLSDFTRLGDFERANDDNRYIIDGLNEIAYDDSDLPRFTAQGLIASILEGHPAQVETLVKGTIRLENIRKGTIEGMQRAKEAGIHIGRPAEDDSDIMDKYPEVIKCIKNGVSLRKTASQCGVSVNTVRKVKSIFEQYQQS